MISRKQDLMNILVLLIKKLQDCFKEQVQMLIYFKRKRL